MITDEKLQELFMAANIGQRLLIKRKELNLSRTDFAKKLNVSSNTLSKYEKSESLPSPDIIKQIIEILDINIEDFLSGRHQHMLDVRILLKQELEFINQRIKELEKLTRYYEFERQDVQELLDEDCSFATDFDDVEVNYEFSGNGSWLSEKLYLTKGVYSFSVESDNPGYTVLDIYDIVQNKNKTIFYEKIPQNFKAPFIIEKTGYYLLHFEKIKGNWNMALQKATIRS